MCSFGSSNASAPTTQYSGQTTTASPQAQAMYNQAWGQASKVAQRPFTPYSYDPNAFAAPMNPVQMGAVNDISGLQGAANPFYAAGAGMVGNAGMTSSAGIMGAYTNPYMSQIVDPVRASIEQQQAGQRQQLNADQIKAGAFGQERGQLMRAVLAGQQNMGLGNALSPLYQDAFKTGLGAAQTDLQRQLGAGQTMGQLGSGLVSSNLGVANAQLGAGTIGQQTQQQGLQGLYNQYMMQQMYPYQQAQFLSSVAAGLGPGYGGTTTGFQSSMQPLSYFGNQLSDPALKVGADGEEPEVIGQTNDGQPIYRYRVMNPETGEPGPVQIGLMADEVEQRRPDAIGDYKGFRTVDYEKATDGAARMGGGVMPEGGDYAAGGGVMGGGGLIPEFNMPTARLDMPGLSYQSAEPQKKQSFLSQLGETSKNLLELYDTGKKAQKLYEGDGAKSTGSAEPRNWENAWSGNGLYARGGEVDEPQMDMTGGIQQPVAKLDAPRLSFAEPEKEKKSGLGDALGTAIDIGKLAMQAYTLSDRRLKTGVRPGRADGGGFLDDLASALSGHGYIDGSTWERSADAGKPIDVTPGLRPHIVERPARGHVGVTPAPARRPAIAAPPPARPAGVQPHYPSLQQELAMGRHNMEWPTLDEERAMARHNIEYPTLDEELAMGRQNAGFGRLVGMARGGPSPDDEDLDYLARTLVKEAGDEGERGMGAVADVIRNRLNSGRYGKSVKDVVLAPKQFSPWNDEMRGTRADPRGLDAASPLYAKARGIGAAAFGPDHEDVTGGATHFFNPDLANPKWARGKEGLDIGHHRFLQADAGANAGLGRALGYAAKEPGPKFPPDMIDREPTGSISKGLAPKSAEEWPAQGLAGMIRGTPAKDMGERAGDFLTSERFVVPLLSGLGAMASSNSRFLGPAILQGLGAGAQSYMGVQKAQADISKAEEEARTQKAETAAREAMTPKIKAETKKQMIDNLRSSIFQTPAGNVVFLADGSVMPFAQYIDLAQSGKPPGLMGSVPDNAAEIVQQGGAGASEGSSGNPATQPSSPPAAGAPKPQTIENPNDIYDRRSFDTARRERELALNGGPAAEAAAKTTEAYRNYVTGEVTGARENAPYVKELSTTLADAYARHGFDEPGFRSGLRSEISSFANTLYHALGGDPSIDLSKLKDSNDVVNKISTLLATQRSAAGGQHAYAALEAIKAAIPNLDMDKGAGAELTAQLMALQQRADDRDKHFRAYMKDSNGLAADAAEDFTKKSASRYQMEQKILKDLMLHRPEALKIMMSGAGVTAQQIEEKIKKWYGKKAPSGMWRYFAPAQ